MAKTTPLLNRWTCPKCGSIMNPAKKDIHKCMESLSTNRFQKDVDNGVRRLLNK